MEKYRIENIQKVQLNGKNVKIFKVFEYDDESNAYVFIGQFVAPKKTSNKKLIDFVEK